MRSKSPMMSCRSRKSSAMRDEESKYMSLKRIKSIVVEQKVGNFVEKKLSKYDSNKLENEKIQKMTAKLQSLKSKENKLKFKIERELLKIKNNWLFINKVW